MGRRRRYWGHYRASHSSAPSPFAGLGGIQNDIQKHFLGFSCEDLDELLDVYEEIHGKAAASYARTTFPKWRKGAVQLSGRVRERLLHLVPPLLSVEDRFDLVKKIRDSSWKKVRRTVHARPEDWREKLLPVLEEVIQTSSSVRLGDSVKNRVKWLAAGDVAASERLLVAAEEEEALVRVRFLRQEFEQIERVVSQTEQFHTSISHEIRLPQGSIQVFIVSPAPTLWERVKNWMG